MGDETERTVTTNVRPIESEPRVPARSSGILGPFSFRDFRLLWSGLIISNLGTWMQFTALGYLVVAMTPSARTGSLYVGILGASNAVPALLLSPFAGVVADRFPRRRVLLITNIMTSVIALSLALLSQFHVLHLWEIFVLSGARAATQSFDAPARQSWVPVLVPREYVGNAIGLNSIAFNGPSVLGPPIAGVLILTAGVQMAFYFNAISTLAVVLALLFMKPAPPSSTTRESVLTSIAAGVRFLFGHPVLRSVITLLLVTCICVRPYSQLMPAYARHVVHVDARGLGILLAASGVGAIAGSIITAIVGSRRRGVVWFASAVVMSLASIALGLTHVFWIALPILTVLGVAVLSFAGSSNVLLQTLAPDDMRGRAISVFSMILLGGVPLGSLALGALASVTGLSSAMC
ncbi:MAG TPA: MFS transporter, partial [Candidatus Baltobacteraceae bacterium]